MRKYWPAILILTVFVGVAWAQGPTVPPPTEQPIGVQSDTKVFWTMILGFAATIIANLVTAWKEASQRRAAQDAAQLERDANEKRRQADVEAAERQRKMDVEDAERKRKWDLEDRQLAREKQELALKAQTEELKRVTELKAQLAEQTAARVKAELLNAQLEQKALIQGTASQLEQKISEGAQKADRAFTEANNLTAKLAEATRAVQSALPPGRRRTDNPDLAALQQIAVQTKDKLENETTPAVKETLETVRALREDSSAQS